MANTKQKMGFKRWIKHVFHRKKANRSLGGNMAVILLLLVFAAAMAVPLVYAILNSLKPYEEIFIFPPKFYVVNPTFNNFRDLFAMFASSQVPFMRYVLNSVMMSAITTVLVIFLSSMAAYPMAKNKFFGKEALFTIITLSLLFVPSVTGLPQYIIMAKLGFLDSWLAIICPWIGGTMGVFLMKNFMEVIPTALIEAARIDGASEFGIYFRIVMPNVKPAWLTLTVLTFQGAWHSTGGSFIFTEQLKMLPTAISQLIAANSIARMGVASASTVFLMVPPLVMFIVSQSGVLQTMAHAGIKE